MQNGAQNGHPVRVSVDRERFILTRERVLSESPARVGIGTLGEKPLHRILKYYFEPSGEYHEVKYGGFVADIMRDGKITEIQTAGLYKLREKLGRYLLDCDVTVVCPIAKEKRIHLAGVDGKESKPRISPKRECVLDALSMMLGYEDLIKSGRLTVLCVGLAVDEYRESAPRGKYRPRAYVKTNEIPSELLEITEFKTEEDYLSALPPELSERFTVKELAKIMKRKGRYAQNVITLLVRLGVLDRVGKIGRAYIYSKI